MTRERLHKIHISVTKSQLEYLNTTGNRSAYIRFLVARDMRGADQATLATTGGSVIIRKARPKAIPLLRREQKETVKRLTPEFGQELKNALKETSK